MLRCRICFFCAVFNYSPAKLQLNRNMSLKTTLKNIVTWEDDTKIGRTQWITYCSVEHVKRSFFLIQKASPFDWTMHTVDSHLRKISMTTNLSFEQKKSGAKLQTCGLVLTDVLMWQTSTQATTLLFSFVPPSHDWCYLECYFIIWNFSYASKLLCPCTELSSVDYCITKITSTVKSENAVNTSVCRKQHN